MKRNLLNVRRIIGTPIKIKPIADKITPTNSNNNQLQGSPELRTLKQTYYRAVQNYEH